MADHQDQDAEISELNNRESDQSLEENGDLSSDIEEISGVETNQTHHQEGEGIEENGDLNADIEVLNARILAVNSLLEDNDSDIEDLNARVRILNANLYDQIALDFYRCLLHAQTVIIIHAYNLLYAMEAVNGGYNPAYSEDSDYNSSSSEDSDHNSSSSEDSDNNSSSSEDIDDTEEEEEDVNGGYNPFMPLPDIRRVRIINSTTNGLIQDMIVEFNVKKTVKSLKQEIKRHTGFLVRNQDLISQNGDPMLDGIEFEYQVNHGQLDDLSVILTVNENDFMFQQLVRLEELGIINRPVHVNYIYVLLLTYIRLLHVVLQN